MTIELDDDVRTAASEPYVSVWLQGQPVDGVVTDYYHRGRYVDRWSLRAGVWAIDHRPYLGDLYREEVRSVSGDVELTGRRNTTDQSYAAFR